MVNQKSKQLTRTYSIKSFQDIKKCAKGCPVVCIVICQGFLQNYCTHMCRMSGFKSKLQFTGKEAIVIFLKYTIIKNFDENKTQIYASKIGNICNVNIAAFRYGNNSARTQVFRWKTMHQNCQKSEPITHSHGSARVF